MRKLVVLAFVALLVSCGDDTIAPDRMAPDGGSAEISDAAQGEDHNPGIWWLTPIVENHPTTTGTFQGQLSPIVRVICFASNQPDCGTDPEIDTFTKGDGLIVGSDHFKVDFDTHAYPQLQTTSGDRSVYTTYRIEVYTESLFGNSLLMAYADFQLAENGREARSLVDDYMVALVDNQTLPIRFFVNEFAYPHELETNPVSTGEPGGTLCQINCTVAVLEPGVATEVSLVDENGFEQTAVEFDGDETVVRRILVIDQKDPDAVDPATEPVCAPGYNARKENCFGYEVFPSTDPAPLGVPFAAPFRLGVCPVGITFNSPGTWVLTEVDFDAAGNPIVEYVEDTIEPNDVSDFLPCPGNDGSGDGTVVTFLEPFLNLFVRRLYAEDTRVWGATDDDFSHWLWSVPARAETVTPGASLPEGATYELSAQVLATHPELHDGQAIGLGGVDVTFTLATGRGSLSADGGAGAASVTVATDANGIATAALIAGAGLNLVHAESPDAETADGNPLAFSVTGQGLISRWTGDATTPDAFGDVAGANHGTVTGPVTIDAGGVTDNALRFDAGDGEAAGGFVQAPGTDIVNALNFTLATWVNIDAGAPENIVQRFITVQQEKAVLRVDGANSPGQLHFYARFIDPEVADGTILKHVRFKGPLTQGCYQHVAGTYDGATLRLYLNGIEVGSLDHAGMSVVGDGVVLGSHDEPLFGRLDDARIYNTALSPTDIGTLASGAPIGCQPDLTLASSFTFTPTTIEAGKQVTIDAWSVKNQGGPVPSGTSVEAGLYLSTDATITTADVNLGGYIVSSSGLAAGQVVNLDRAQFVIPAATTPGNYHMGVLLDHRGLVAESDEGNNTASAPLVVETAQNTEILFFSRRDGNHEIYGMNADGTHQVRLTNAAGDDFFAAWSHDGTKIAFGSDREGNPDIYVMNADGSSVENLTNNAAADHTPAWSPDGTKIAFQSDRDGAPDIFLMNTDGSSPVNLTNRTNGSELHAAWSPDGSKIAFRSNRDGDTEIYVMDANGDNPNRLTFSAGVDSRPAWSPDGTKIAFESARDDVDGSNFNIYVMNVDGSNPVQLTTDPGFDGAPAWSPDGRILFETIRNGFFQIYIMNQDGSSQTNLTNTESSERWPAWRP